MHGRSRKVDQQPSGLRRVIVNGLKKPKWETTARIALDINNSYQIQLALKVFESGSKARTDHEERPGGNEHDHRRCASVELQFRRAKEEKNIHAKHLYERLNHTSLIMKHHNRFSHTYIHKRYSKKDSISNEYVHEPGVWSCVLSVLTAH